MGKLVENLSFVFLHGFLGQPSDWDPIIADLQKEFPEHSYLALDYFAQPPLSPKVDFDLWTENFINTLGAEFGDKPIVLVGYSLGGRLILNALRAQSDRFQFAFLISTNPGFLDTQAEEKEKRWQHDQQWAERFLTGDWEQVVREWNAQPVFAGSRNEPERIESQFRRDLLAKALTQWSVSHQPDLRSVLFREQKKIGWIVGDLDKKYIQLTKEIFKDCADMTYHICPNSSHRVLVDNPNEVARSISRTLRKVILKSGS